MKMRVGELSRAAAASSVCYRPTACQCGCRLYDKPESGASNQFNATSSHAYSHQSTTFDPVSTAGLAPSHSCYQNGQSTGNIVCLREYNYLDSEVGITTAVRSKQMSYFVFKNINTNTSRNKEKINFSC